MLNPVLECRVSRTMQCGLRRSKLTVKLSFPAKTLCLIHLKLLGTREQMNFASLTPGQLHKESNTMTLHLNLFNLFNPVNCGNGLAVASL